MNKLQNLMGQLKLGQALPTSNNVLDPNLTADELANQRDKELEDVETQKPVKAFIPSNDDAQQEVADIQSQEEKDTQYPQGEISTENVDNLIPASGNLFDNVIDDKPPAPPTPQTEYQKLESKLQELRDLESAQNETASKYNFGAKAAAILGDTLARYNTGGIQRNVKAPLQYTGPKLSEVMAMIGEVKTPNLADQRKELLEQYKYLKTGAGSKGSDFQIIQKEEDGKIALYKHNKLTGEESRLGNAPLRMQFRTDQNTGLTDVYNPLKAGAGTTVNAPKQVAPTKDEIIDIEEATRQTHKSLNPVQKKSLEATIKDFNKDTKKEKDSLGAINNLSTTLDLAKDNKAAASAFGTQLAQVFQDGRLSDKDVDLYVKDKQLLQKIRTGYFDMVDGTIDPKKIPEYRQLIKSMQQGLNSNIDIKASYFAQQRLGTIIENPEIAKNLIHPKLNTMKQQSPKEDQPQSGKFNLPEGRKETDTINGKEYKWNYNTGKYNPTKREN